MSCVDRLISYQNQFKFGILIVVMLATFVSSGCAQINGASTNQQPTKTIPEAVNSFYNPEDASGYNNRGVSFKNSGEYEKALEDYNKAIELSPEYYVAYMNRGNLYKLMGEYESALADYDTVLSILPGDTTTYYNRSLTYADSGDYASAIADYQQYLEFNPDSPIKDDMSAQIFEWQKLLDE